MVNSVSYFLASADSNTLSSECCLSENFNACWKIGWSKTANWSRTTYTLMLLYFTNNNFLLSVFTYKKLNNDCCKKSRKTHEKCRLTLYTCKLVTKCWVTLHAICKMRSANRSFAQVDDEIRVLSGKSQLSQSVSAIAQSLKFWKKHHFSFVSSVTIRELQ